MGKSLKNFGFSLTEVLLSVGILSVGMIFIAGVFPVGIHFTTIATEQTIAAVVADEAFAKIKIYAIGEPSKNAPGNDNIDLDQLETDGLKPDEFTKFDDIFPAAANIDPNLKENEFAYPSADTGSQKQYYWSALCRLTEEYKKDYNPNPPVQVTVFVSRKVSPNLKYRTLDGDDDADWPMPIKVEVSTSVSGNDNELKIDKPEEKTFINDGYMIVDDETGRIYRVLERYRDDPHTAEEEDKIILLDRDWDYESAPPDEVWVVPPAVNGGRCPCIAIYQKVISF